MGCRAEGRCEAPLREWNYRRNETGRFHRHTGYKSTGSIGRTPDEPTIGWGALMGSAVSATQVEVVEGNLLDQDVEVIVNAWNRNIIPWWLLLPQGVSGAIKRRGGKAPFKELGKARLDSTRRAVPNLAGTLPFKGSFTLPESTCCGGASERSIRESVKNATSLASEKGFKSIAFPLIGAGSGGFNQDQAKSLILDELSKLDLPMMVKVVVFFF